MAIQAGAPCSGVRLEVLPRHSEWPGPELGDAAKIPLGVHPLSGRRCFLLDEEGMAITDPARALDGLRRLRHAELPALLETLSKVSPASPAPEQPADDEVARLLTECNVLSSLCERARQMGHLRHTHNLILLYTAGRLGEPGARFIHSTLAHCRNYSPSICQRYIDQLQVEHPPLSCRRIREWLDEEGEGGLCTCSPSRHTPLEGIRQAPKPNAPRRTAPEAPSRKPTEEDTQLWSEVAADLFTDDDHLAEEDASDMPEGGE